MGDGRRKPRVPRTPATLLALSVALALAWPAGAHPPLQHAIERVTRALAAHPDRPELWLQRGSLHRRNRQFKESLADLAQARTLDARHPQIDLERGRTLAAAEAIGEAEAAFTRALRHRATAAVAYRERGDLRAHDGRSELALSDYAEALRRQPDVALYLKRGALQEQSGALDDACRGYREGLRRIGPATALTLALVAVESARGDHAAAITLVDAELVRARVKTVWYLRRAELWNAAGKTAPARADLGRALAEADRVLQRRPHALQLYFRARVHEARGEREEALRDLQRAVANTPGYPPAQSMLEDLEREGVP